MHIFSDMDGVIAEYIPELYTTPDGSKPPFLTVGQHCFYHLKPYYNIKTVFETLAHEGHQITILTNLVQNPLMEYEWTQDKTEWIKKYFSFIDLENFHIIYEPKYIYAQRLINRELNFTDILISDYNEDLNPWEHAGGTGIKCLNGINSSSSFNGQHIDINSDPQEILHTLKTIYEKKRKELKTD